jgi:hypothetical protein
MRRRVKIPLVGIAAGAGITLMGLAGAELARWPGALVVFIFGGGVLGALGLEGGPKLSPAQSIVLNVIFFVSNIGFWSIPALILAYRELKD